MTRNYEDILDFELTRILAGEASIDSCCAENADIADDLRPLLELALAGRDALRVEVPSDSRQSTRDRLVKRVANAPRKSTPGRRLMRPLALAAGLMMLLSAGTALAASGAAPDSILYPLKQRLEGAGTALAYQSVDRAKAEIGHADARLDELDSMAGMGKTEYIAGLLAHYDVHINNAVNYRNIAAGDGEDTAEVEGMLLSSRLRHDQIVESLLESGDLPEDAAKALQESMNDGDSGGGKVCPDPDGGDLAGNEGGSESGNPRGGSGNESGDPGDRQEYNGDSGQTGNHDSEESQHSGGSDDGSGSYQHQDPSDEQTSDSSQHDTGSEDNHPVEEAKGMDASQSQPHYDGPHMTATGQNGGR